MPLRLPTRRPGRRPFAPCPRKPTGRWLRRWQMGKKPSPQRAQDAARAMERAPLAQPVMIPQPRNTLRQEPPAAPEAVPESAKPAPEPEAGAGGPADAGRRSPSPSWESCLTPILWPSRGRRPSSLTSTPPTSGSCSTGSGPKKAGDRFPDPSGSPGMPPGAGGAALVLENPLCWMSWAMGWRNSGRERCCCARFPWTSPRSRGGLPHQPGPGSSGGPAGGPGQSAGQPPSHHGLQGRHQSRLAYRSPGAGGPGAAGAGPGRPEVLPHGRPVCIRLTKQQLERQFGRA